MNAQPDLIKQSQLLNRLVIDRRTAEEVGRLEQLWLNPQSHQVVGLTCKSGILGNKKRSFTWAEIDAIGADSILVNNSPEMIDSEKPESSVALIGHEVWTDVGNKAGKLVDYLFVRQTGAIANYLFVSSGWRGALDGVYLFLPTDAISVGSKRIIVADAIAQVPQLYAEGLNQRVTQVAEFLKEDYEKTKRDIDSIARGTQEIAEQVKDKAKEKPGQPNAEPDAVLLEEANINTIEVTAESLPSDKLAD